MKVIVTMVAVMLMAIGTQVKAEYPDPKIVGTYKYQEKGSTGTMKITISKYANFSIETESKKGYCNLEGAMFEEDSKKLPTIGQIGDDSNAKFKVRFSGKTVQLSDAESIGSVCGMKAEGKFTGKWVKVK